MSDRRKGIGSDGLIVVRASAKGRRGWKCTIPTGAAPRCVEMAFGSSPSSSPTGASSAATPRSSRATPASTTWRSSGAAGASSARASGWGAQRRDVADPRRRSKRKDRPGWIPNDRRRRRARDLPIDGKPALRPVRRRRRESPRRHAARPHARARPAIRRTHQRGVRAGALARRDPRAHVGARRGDSRVRLGACAAAVGRHRRGARRPAGRRPPARRRSRGRVAAGGRGALERAGPTYLSLGFGSRARRSRAEANGCSICCLGS